MSILVTGGAGYIGSITVQLLKENSHNVIVLDNLSRGNKGAMEKDTVFFEGNINDKDLVRQIVRDYNVDTCIHFAAYAYVGESVKNPKMYFENNVTSSICFLDTLVEENVKNIVFSSSCAVYGIPLSLPISEDSPLLPINPYGWTKFFFEKILKSYRDAYGLNYIALRYFNVGGATDTHGEYHQPETHIIPNILAAANGEKSCITINGKDHNTADGTAVRDYVHVHDLANAHVKATQYLKSMNLSHVINIGNKKGYSILELINTCEEVTAKKIEKRFVDKLEGDPPALIANYDKAAKILKWSPKLDLVDIVSSAWKWKQNYPNGYP